VCKVIYISGKKRAGKDTFANYLKVYLNSIGYKTEIFSFADPLKDIMAITLGLSLQELDDLKNDTTKPHRQYLQRFGSDGMKKYFGSKVWANLADIRIRNSRKQICIIPDLRFEHEINKNINHTVIRINGLENSEKDTHISENSLDDYFFDYVINNHDSLFILEENARKFADHYVQKEFK